MQAISRKEPKDACVINILPCRLHHDGPTKVSKRYWTPQAKEDGTRVAHFRGRRLKGRLIKIPVGYQGLVLKATDKTIVESAPIIEDDDEEPELPNPIKIVEEVSSFEEMVIWGHDQNPASDNNFAKGVEEWISFAEAIHGK